MYPARGPDAHSAPEWLVRLSGDDPARRRMVQRAARRLRRNERAPGPLRRLLQRAAALA